MDNKRAKERGHGFVTIHSITAYLKQKMKNHHVLRLVLSTLYNYYIVRQQPLRTATSCFRGLPDFVIIGYSKCGTTSLYDFMVKHPNIKPAVTKEIIYFTSKYDHGTRWYRSNFPTNISKYYSYKKTGQTVLTGESTPRYITHNETAPRMKKIIPDVKLIVILRNPVDRAYSHYHHMKRGTIGREFVQNMSFEQYIKTEEFINSICDIPVHFTNYRVLKTGIYIDYLQNWFKYYDRKQFLFLCTEDFYENPQQTLDKTFDFLELPPFKANNLTNFNVGNYKKKMNEDTRKHLIEYYKPHNKRLYRLLGRDFNWD